MPAMDQIDHFLSLNDTEFVNALYKHILQREPDPVGFKSYLDLVRAGEDKLNLFYAMANSAEGRTKAPAFPGYRAFSLRKKIERMPVFGALVRIVYSIRRILAIANRLEERLYFLERRMGDRLGMLESEIHQITAHTQEGHQEIRSRLDKISGILEEMTTGLPAGIISAQPKIMDSGPSYLKTLSPNARGIYQKLRTIVER
jgi:hypothetical protein